MIARLWLMSIGRALKEGRDISALNFLCTQSPAPIISRLIAPFADQAGALLCARDRRSGQHTQNAPLRTRKLEPPRDRLAPARCVARKGQGVMIINSEI